MTISYEKTTDLPVCPSCKKEMSHLLQCDALGKGFFGGRTKVILMCPHCKVFLGAADADNG